MSLRTLAFLALAAVPVGCAAAPPDEDVGEGADAITGGKPTTGHAAVGLLNVDNESICTGSLIAPHVVLTAAHCLKHLYRGELSAAPRVWFFPGDVSSKPVRASRVVIAEGYGCDLSTGNDIAYVVLDASVPNVRPLPVETAERRPGCSFETVGFGRTRPFTAARSLGAGSDAPLCGAASMPPACSGLCYSTVDPNAPPWVPDLAKNSLSGVCTEAGLSKLGEVVARSQQGSTCSGDSGGPLVDLTTGKLVGVLSASVIIDGVKCTRGTGLLFSPTTSFRELITKALAEPKPKAR